MRELSFEKMELTEGGGPKSSDGRNCFLLGLAGTASIISTGGLSLIWLYDDYVDCWNS